MQKVQRNLVKSNSPSFLGCSPNKKIKNKLPSPSVILVEEEEKVLSFGNLSETENEGLRISKSFIKLKRCEGHKDSPKKFDVPSL